MMESCLNVEPERQQVDVEDVKRDLSSEFSIAPSSSGTEDEKHLQVFLRIRPFTSAESSNGECQDCVTIEPPDTVLLKPPRLSLSTNTDRPLPQTGQRFQFSQVYGPDTTQRELFEGTVKDLVKDVFRGENSLVFTYGVTNAGKTFTFLGPDADMGVVPRTLALMFSSINQQIFPGMSIKPHRCREFITLTPEQQDKEALFKRNLLRQLKESDKSTSAFLNCDRNTEGSSLLGWSLSLEDDSVVELAADSRFSVWVSFCEIYNENIHDLLEAVPCGAVRRAALRLSQDVKGNSFVKDLRWVQVNSAEEAHWVLRLGKRNQSFSSTRLNHLSSRSHSIFSIRVLRIEDIGTPRVQTISELCLCDLAGSERCGKTQNNGERLKEAGNINTSLLILGKCINALRHNQKAKLFQHVPFRESKLTHYLQGFFRGHGKACMIVNINQCASMYDETLNVLKFSAVAQKVVVLSSRPPPIMSQKASSEISILINSSDREERANSRRSSLIGWESSLEDVLEDESCDEYEEEEEIEETVLEETLNLSDNDEKIVVSRKHHQRQEALLEQLQEQLKMERAETLLMEARVREDIGREFSELFSKMQTDYNERLARETKILEERAEHRMKIFQNLVQKMSSGDDGQKHRAMEDVEDSPWTLAEVESVCGRVEVSSGAAAQETHRAGRVEDNGRLCLVSELEQKCSDVLRLQERVSELQKRLDQESKSSQEAAAALEKERRDKEETVVALDKQKEEGRRRQKEELTLRQQFTQMADKMEAAERRAEMEVQRVQQAAARLQAAQKQQEEQSARANSLSLEVERLKQELQASSISSACEGDQLREQAAELRKALDQEKQRQQNITQQLEQLTRTAQEQEEKSRQHLEKLQTKLQQSTEEASELQEQVQQLHHMLRAQEDGADGPDPSSTSEAKDLRRMNSDLQAEISAMKLKVSCFENPSRTQDLLPSAELLEKLAEMKKSSVQREATLQETLQEKEQQVVNLQEKLQEKEQQVVNLQEKLQEKEQQVVNLQETIQEKEQQVVNLQEKLQEKEQQVVNLQEKLQEKEQQVVNLQEQHDQAESHGIQEARRREVERRRELLAAAHEALAMKEEELQRNMLEINRLKENAAQDSEKVQNLSGELQRREDESSDLRDKLADYKKQVQQVHNQVSVMKEEEKKLRLKLSDMEKTRKQLQCEMGVRDRTIQQLRTELSSNTKCEQKDQLYQKACEDLKAKEQAIEGMRLALTEQEVTQEQMEKVLEENVSQVQELTTELEKLKAMLSQQDHMNQHTPTKPDEAARAQDILKAQTDRHQEERRKWQEEKMSLIGQTKAAEERRNQEMKKFVEDKERYSRQQNQLECQLSEKQQTMDVWKKERDTLVAALEVQLKKLLCSQSEKDKIIKELSSHSDKPAEAAAELQALLSERDAEIQRLKDELEASRTSQAQRRAAAGAHHQSESTTPVTGNARASVCSQTSFSCPSVLESSEISTENGRTSRFPQPELEISFSPLQPNRMALRRQGQRDAVTVKITRSGRKRKSGEMEKSHIFRRSKRRTRLEDDAEAENRKNRSKLTTHQEESAAHSTKKEGTLQKIGDFLQSSPTLLGAKAKKMMSLVSGRGTADAAASSSSSSSSLRVKRSKRKLYNPEISSPMEMPSHPIISREPKESDHQIIKRRLRSRRDQ